MRGNVYDIRIDVENILLKLEEKQEYYLPLNIKEYNVNKEELEDILKDIEYYNLPEWSKLEYDTDNVILDGTSSVIHFVYDNSKISNHRKDWYTIELNSKVSHKVHEVLYSY